MNIALWVLQIILALMFVMAGSLKATQPLDNLAKRMAWVPAVPGALVRFIGISELLGAIGLILPALIHVLPWLTIAAAIGLAVIMFLAILVHGSRREYQNIIANVVLLALLVFVVYGRIALAPF